MLRFLSDGRAAATTDRDKKVPIDRMEQNRSNKSFLVPTTVFPTGMILLS